ncbi:MAG: hypothetical protein C0514_04950 [Candidatus Puniceispirillum sp.]|nr:hypothetical protein [Candidatus Puniceispirillum sp.]
MFKNKFLKYATLLGVSLLASTCIQASELEADDLMDVDVFQTTTIVQIPRDRLVEIFSYLSAEEAAIARGVCRLWRDVLNDEHAVAFSNANVLFDPTPSTHASSIPDEDMAQTLAFHITRGGFAPLENVFISPDLYPQCTRLLKASDLEAHPDILNAWHATLFGEDAPQNVRSAGLVMAALPRMLVREVMDKNTVQAMTPYVQTLANHTRFKALKGQEGTEDLEVFKSAPHTLVVRANDLQTYEFGLRTLLTTRDDHSVVVSFEDETFIKNGVLSLSKSDIPDTLHHLILSDPYDWATRIDNRFLACANGIVTLQAKHFGNVGSIGINFLFGSKALTKCDVRGFAQVTQVESAFLMCCPSLPNFDTRGFASLIHVGGGFLMRDERLSHFDGRGLSKVESIYHGFLMKCVSLKTFDLTPLVQLKALGKNFLLDTGVPEDELIQIYVRLANMRLQRMT